MSDGNGNTGTSGFGNLSGGGNLSGNLGNLGNLDINPLTPNLGDDIPPEEEEPTPEETPEENSGMEEGFDPEEPIYTGETQTVNETIEYSMEERKENAMSLAEMIADLETLKQEYNDLIIETNNAVREKRAEIQALEDEISEAKAGVVNGSITKQVTYDIYDTIDKKIFVPINLEPIEANFAKVINKTAAEIAQFKLAHGMSLNEPDVTTQPVVDNQETM